MAKKRIHKFVDCEDNFTAEIFCEYDDETKEVIEESVIFANSEADYTSQSLQSKELENARIKKHILNRLPTQFKKTEVTSRNSSRP